MMNCSEIRELITLYIDNEMESNMQNCFEEHIKNCEACRTELEEITRVVELCAGMPEEELPETFKEQLHNKLVDIDRQENNNKKTVFLKNRYIKVVSTVAAVFLVFITLSGIYGNDFMKGRFLSGSGKSKNAEMAAESRDAKAAKSLESQADAGIMKSGEKPEVFAPDLYDMNADKLSKGEVDSTDTANDATRGFVEGRSFTMMALPELREIGIAVKSDDINKQAEIIEKYANELGLEAVKKKVQYGGTQENDAEKIYLTAASGETVEMQVTVPNAEYERFIENLKSDPELSETLTFGKMQNISVDEYLNGLKNKLDETNKIIDEAENSKDAQEKAELERLIKERDAIKSDIERITSKHDYTIIKFTIQKED